MNGREMFTQTSAKQTNAQTEARQPNKQVVECTGRRSLPKWQKRFKQQQQQHDRIRRLKDDFTLNPRISREFRFSFSTRILSEISQT